MKIIGVYLVHIPLVPNVQTPMVPVLNVVQIIIWLLLQAVFSAILNAQLVRPHLIKAAPNVTLITTSLLLQTVFNAILNVHLVLVPPARAAHNVTQVITLLPPLRVLFVQPTAPCALQQALQAVLSVTRITISLLSTPVHLALQIVLPALLPALLAALPASLIITLLQQTIAKFAPEIVRLVPKVESLRDALRACLTTILLL